MRSKPDGSSRSMDGMNSLTLQLFCDCEIAKLDDYKKSYLKTQAEWKRFVSGSNDIDFCIIPEEILAAWVCCRSRGPDPFQIPPKSILTGDALHALLEKNKKFMEAGRPFLTNLYRFLEGSGVHVILFDRNPIAEKLNLSRATIYRKIKKYGFCVKEK